MSEAKAFCVAVRNPFDPVGSASHFEIDAGRTVGEMLIDGGIGPDMWGQGARIAIDGEDLPVAAYPVRTIRPGEVVTIVSELRGAGGGGGKSPLKTVLMIAVMIAATPIAEAAWGAMGMQAVTGASSLATKLAFGALKGIISLAGTTLINIMIPNRPASAAVSYGGYASAPAPSPTYSLQGQGNTARLGQPIACQFGRHKVYPDLIMAQPYTEYVDNEAYLFQPHCLGLGEYDIEAMRIGETDIENFEEVETEVVAPGEAVTLFDVNVSTSAEVSGQELPGTNEQTGTEYVGPFTLNAVDTVAHHIGIDIVMPRGLYYAENDGSLSSKTITWTVEAREIDDDNLPVGAGTWSTLGSESVTDTTTTPIRLSYKYAAPHDRCEARARRTDVKDTSSRAGHDLAWAGMRAYIDGPDTFEDATLLLVKMRATNNLSARSSRLINVIQTRKIPVWDPETETWSEPTASRSIAWAIAEVIRADYGAGLPDSRVPLDELAALDSVWESRNNHFDGVFDSATTVWDALGRIARCGRAVPIPFALNPDLVGGFSVVSARSLVARDTSDGAPEVPDPPSAFELERHAATPPILFTCSGQNRR